MEKKTIKRKISVGSQKNNTKTTVSTKKDINEKDFSIEIKKEEPKVVKNDKPRLSKSPNIKNTLRTNYDKTYKCLNNDLCSVAPLVLTVDEIKDNGDLVFHYTKSIIGTDSSSFIHDIAFAIHNKFTEFSIDDIITAIEIVDVSNTKFNLII